MSRSPERGSSPTTLLTYFYTLTSLHAGAESGLGAIDLPLQRERMSGLPQIQGSGVKGAWRDEARRRIDPAMVTALFGSEAVENTGSPESTEQNEAQASSNGKKSYLDKKVQEMQAGALSLSDARLLLFPVRSARGAFAWLTCPLVLERLFRDLSLLTCSYRPLDDGLDGLQTLGDDQVLVSTQSRVLAGDRVVLEDLDYSARASKLVDELATWLVNHALPEGHQRDRLAAQLVVMSDGEFQQMTQLRTEVVTRVRISAETHTVAKGALWTEEQLPAESLLYSVVRITQELRRAKPKEKAPATEAELVSTFCTLAKDHAYFHMGGDRTLGRGLVQVRVSERPELLSLPNPELVGSTPEAPAALSRQARIQAALKVVDALKGGKQGEESGLQLCIKLPSLLLNNGLGQTLAFLMAKGGEHRKLLDGLTPVLRHHGLSNADNTARWIAGASPQQVRRAMQDVMDFAGWAKRFAQAEKKD